MELKDFLRLVVPDAETLCVAKQLEKGFSQFPVTGVENAAKLSLFLDGQQSNVFFALASFKERHNNEFGKERVARKRKNVDKLKALWLDMDFKDCPAEELMPKFKSFLNDTGFPAPSVLVNSGGGIHAYWAFTHSIKLDEWLPLAQGFKSLCQKHDLPADHMCTADASRVLRPPETHNYKYDPPRPVKVIAHRPEGVFTPNSLAELLPKKTASSPLGDIPEHLRGVKFDDKEFTGSNHKREVDTKQVIRNCAVLRHIMSTGGAEQSEPEWNSTLLLLKYLPDGEKLIHAMSDKHIDYDNAVTQAKWEAKLEAETSGPTLCATMESFGHTSRCKECPIYKSRKSKTPLALGYVNDVPKSEGQVPKSGPRLVSVSVLSHDFPDNWRGIPGNEGVERKVYDKGAGEWVWDRALKRTWRLKEVQRSVSSGMYSIQVESAQRNGKRLSIDIPGGFIGGCPELWKLLGDHGAVVPGDERNAWIMLMATWLQKLQEENAELDTVDRFGWLRNPDPEDSHITGFSAGAKTFMSNGDDKDTVRIKREHEQLGKLYRPHGRIEEWKKAAEYITNQNNAAFTTILASAFAAPLITFADLPGAVLTIVSTESGVGKTSALRTAQAVWGSPQKAMNSTGDTALSITKKIGFLNNLPAYWDEIRGQSSLDAFYNVAFDIAQGKEKTRLTQTSQLREIHDWQTMVVAASNDSLFDYMAQKGGHSNASIARTFEVVVDAGEITPDLSATPLFGMLDLNYGHAGQVYSEHLARNHKKIEARMRDMTQKTREWADNGGERFWCAIIAALIVGAKEANRCGIVDIDIHNLAGYLKDNLLRLRSRTGTAMQSTSPRELVGDYFQHYQNGEMIIDRFPNRGETDYQPVVTKNPSSGLMYVRAGSVYRFRRSDFAHWLTKARNMQMSSIWPEMVAHLNAAQMNSLLGIKTSHELARSRLLEVDMATVTDVIGDNDDE